MFESGSVHGIVIAGTYPAAGSALDALVPRPLLPVAQQPLITYALRWMQRAGVAHGTVCANSAARSIRTRLDAATLGMGLDYLEDWNPRGAAGCVRDAGTRREADTYVVADGTAVPEVDAAELLERHVASGAVLTVVVGADASGRLCPSGVYVFDRRAFDFIPADGFQDIKERLIPRLYEAGQHVGTHVARAVAPRVVNTDTYLALDQWAVERAAQAPDVARGFRVCGEAVVHESTRVDPSARLLGPMLLGPGVSVQSGATLVGPLSLGPGTSVCKGAVVSRSVVWSRCVVGDEALVDRCMLADGARIAPRQPVFAAVRTDESRGREGRSPARAFWEPLVAVLRPASPHEL
jgi:NDP-sugar pyrophosphorylase family protein